MTDYNSISAQAAALKWFLLGLALMVAVLVG